MPGHWTGGVRSQNDGRRLLARMLLTSLEARRAGLLLSAAMVVFMFTFLTIAPGSKSATSLNCIDAETI